MNWKEYMSRVALVAVVSGLDIGLSNGVLDMLLCHSVQIQSDIFNTPLEESNVHSQNNNHQSHPRNTLFPVHINLFYFEKKINYLMEI